MKFKKVITVAAIVLITSLTLIFAFGCAKEPLTLKAEELLSKYDFSISNIESIGLVSLAEGLTPYGNRPVYEVKSGDARLEAMAAAWQNFSDNAVLTHKGKFKYAAEDSVVYVVTFKDLNKYNYVRITYAGEYKGKDCIFIGGGAAYLAEKEDFDIIKKSFELLDKEKDILE